MGRVVTVIGRGHSGTRGVSSWFRSARYFWGPESRVNGTHDFVWTPGYEAAKIALSNLRHLGGLRWDFDGMASNLIDPEFKRLIDEYLAPIYRSDHRRRGFKLPEMVLCYPWLCRTHPDLVFVELFRDPRDVIMKEHGTDDLSKWRLAGFPDLRNTYARRALSWSVQARLILAARPWTSTRFTLDDYVNRTEIVRREVELLVGHDMPPPPVKRDVFGRWKNPSSRRALMPAETHLSPLLPVEGEGTVYGADWSRARRVGAQLRADAGRRLRED